MNQQLANFYDHLNTAVITTNDFQEGTLFRKREKVSQFAYCGLNPVYRKYLSFDLDYPQAGRRFEELKVPPPTIVTTNRSNGHAHYLYELVTPVAYHETARTKPQEFFEAIELELTRQLDADFAFTHTLTKNPLHDRWIVETFPAKYHLSEFTEYFDLPAHDRFKSKAEKCEIRGRNDELFHTLRYWAYAEVKKHTMEEVWHISARQQAEAINDFCYEADEQTGINYSLLESEDVAEIMQKLRGGEGRVPLERLHHFEDHHIDEVREILSHRLYTGDQKEIYFSDVALSQFRMGRIDVATELAIHALTLEEDLVGMAEESDDDAEAEVPFAKKCVKQKMRRDLDAQLPKGKKSTKRQPKL